MANPCHTLNYEPSVKKFNTGPCQTTIDTLRVPDYSDFIPGTDDTDSGLLWASAVAYSRKYPSVIFNQKVNTVTKLLNGQAQAKQGQPNTLGLILTDYSRDVIAPTLRYVEGSAYSKYQEIFDESLSSGLVLFMTLANTYPLSSNNNIVALKFNVLNDIVKKISDRTGCVKQAPRYISLTI